MIRPLISVAAGLLKVGGVLAIEHDDTPGRVRARAARARRVLTDVVDHPDLTGRPRFVTATRVRLTGTVPQRAVNTHGMKRLRGNQRG